MAGDKPTTKVEAAKTAAKPAAKPNKVSKPKPAVDIKAKRKDRKARLQRIHQKEAAKPNADEDKAEGESADKAQVSTRPQKYQRRRIVPLTGTRVGRSRLHGARQRG